jgi:hypothetical protein
MLLGLVITVVLALAGAAGLAVLGQRAAAAGSPFDVAAGDRPALVHLVLTRCHPEAAGYEATILDLAGRGYMSVTGQGPAIGAVETASLWLAPATPAAGSPALLSFEQQVLDDVRARVSDARGAPFDALAGACRVDATGTWKPFEDKLRAASRELGVCGPWLPVSVSSVLVAFGTAAAIVTSASLAEASYRGSAAVAAVIACGVGLVWLWRDRPTRAGSALAARWREHSTLPPGWDSSSPAAELRQSAYAVAVGRETGGSWRGRRQAGTPSKTAKPAQAWSSFTGSWRLVPIGPRPGRALRRGSGLLTVAGVLGFISIPLVITGIIGWLAVVPVFTALALGATGAAGILRTLAIPKQVIFDAQVIARWRTDEEESSGGENEQPVSLPMLAIDDGQQSWTCLASAADFDRTALGDLVRVTVNPRSGTLASIAVTSRTRPESPPAVRPGPLVTPEEAAAVVGPVTRTTGVPVPGPGGLGVIYQGRDGTLSVIVAGGGAAGLNTAIARRMGTPLPGIGDQAWLLNRERTVIVQVGAQVTKLTASKSRPGSLPALASVVAARLADAAPVRDAPR